MERPDCVVGLPGRMIAQSRESLLDAIGTLLKAGAAEAVLRSDVAPADVMASLSGVSLIAGAPEQRDQAGCSTCSSTACATTRQPAETGPLTFNRGP